MRFERFRWFHCVFWAGLVAGWPKPLRTLAHFIFFIGDAYLCQHFATQSIEDPAFIPGAAFFHVRLLLSAVTFFGGVFGRVRDWFSDAGGDAPMVAIVESVRAEAEGREP